MISGGAPCRSTFVEEAAAFSPPPRPPVVYGSTEAEPIARIYAAIVRAEPG